MERVLRAIEGTVRYAWGWASTSPVLTDNGACYRSKAFHGLCRKRTRPDQRKAERFIQTAQREWAYARFSGNPEQQDQHLSAWLHLYNGHRPHASLDEQPPISRLGLE